MDAPSELYHRAASHIPPVDCIVRLPVLCLFHGYNVVYVNTVKTSDHKTVLKNEDW